MAVEVIEGNLGSSEPAGGRRKYARYNGLAITRANGQVRSFGKLAAGGAVIDEIRRGGEGRWYVATSGGATAFIGVRRSDGTATYAHYMNTEPMLLVVGLLGVLGGVLKFGIGVEDFPLTPVVLGPLLLLGWWYFRSQRLQQRRFFEADAG
ncbi:MAG: hypothetical protein QM676_10825 [Novosphingobium sp.]